MHANHLPDWIAERSKLMNRFPPLDPARTAVIVIDMQSAFIAPGEVFGNQHALDIVPNINRIVGAFRERGARICWSAHTFVEEGPGAPPPWQIFEGSLSSISGAALRRGTASHAIYPELDFRAGDLLFEKYRFSCFINAALDLNQWLRDQDIEDLVIIGTLTNCCCECTARDATMLDYRVRLIADACAALTDEEQEAALLNVAGIAGPVLTTDALLAEIQA